MANVNVVIESEAELVREVFEAYAKKLWSIGAITRQLNVRGIATRLGFRLNEITRTKPKLSFVYEAQSFHPGLSPA